MLRAASLVVALLLQGACTALAPDLPLKPTAQPWGCWDEAVGCNDRLGRPT